MCQHFDNLVFLPIRTTKRTSKANFRLIIVSKSYPLPQKTIRGYDCRKMAYF
nr:MAG TPA: hypothetical protein [Caudoviricetes sp.]